MSVRKCPPTVKWICLTLVERTSLWDFYRLWFQFKYLTFSKRGTLYYGKSQTLHCPWHRMEILPDFRKVSRWFLYFWKWSIFILVSIKKYYCTIYKKFLMGNNYFSSLRKMSGSGLISWLNWPTNQSSDMLWCLNDFLCAIDQEFHPESNYFESCYRGFHKSLNVI